MGGYSDKNRPLVNVFIDESMGSALSGFLTLKEEARRQIVTHLRAFTHFINHLIVDEQEAINLSSIFDAPQLHVLGESHWASRFRHRVWLLPEADRHQLKEKLAAVSPSLIAVYRQASILFDCLSSSSGEDLEIVIANNDANQGDDESKLDVNVAPVLQACLLLLKANPEDYFLVTQVNKQWRGGITRLKYQPYLIYPEEVIATPRLDEMDKEFLHEIAEDYRCSNLLHYVEWSASKSPEDFNKHEYYEEILVKGSKKAYAILFAIQRIIRRSINAVNLDQFAARNALFVDYMFNEKAKQCYPVLSCFVDNQLSQFQENPRFKAYYNKVIGSLLKESTKESDYEAALKLFHAALYHYAQATFTFYIGNRFDVQYASYVDVGLYDLFKEVMNYDNNEQGYINNVRVDYPEFPLYMSQLALMLDGDNDSLTLQSVYKHSVDGLHHRLVDSRGYAFISHHELMREYLKSYPPQPEKTKQLKEEAIKESSLSIA